MIREELFHTWGKGLDDDDFACALAALGILYGSHHHDWPIKLRYLPYLVKIEETGQPLPWSLPLKKYHGKLSPWIRWLASAKAFAKCWKTAKKSIPPRLVCRLLTQSGDPAYSGEKIRWLMQQLARPAVGAGSVFLECQPETPVSWHWPLRIGISPDSPPALLETITRIVNKFYWKRTLFEVYALSRQHYKCDIAILSSTIFEALYWFFQSNSYIRASCVILLDGYREIDVATARILELLRIKMGAHGLVASEEQVTDMGAFASSLLFHLSRNEPLDVAIGTTFRKVGRGIPFCLYSDELLERARLTTVGDQSISGSSAYFHITMRPQQQIDLLLDHEFGDISELAALPTAAHAAQDQHLRPEPRYIQARVDRPSAEQREEQPRPLRAFMTGIRHVVSVKVGMPEEGWLKPANREPFPDKDLPPSREDYRLRVTFSEPDHIPEPLTGEILLPKTGNSSEVRLAFTPVAGKPNFRGRIIVSFRNRILQTALLTGSVVEIDQPEPETGSIELTAEANVRPVLHDLGDRTAYDLALVFNHDPTGRPSMTVLDKDIAQLRDLESVKEALSAIDKKLSEVASNARDYTQGLKEQCGVDVLRFLAMLGVDLYQFMMDAVKDTPLEGRLDEAEYLQVVDLSKGFSMFPMEYVYSYACPRDDAAICPHYEEALKIGTCWDSCQDRHTGGVVCPLGFWGLSKVIERHAFPPVDRERLPGDALVLAQPVATRNTLNISGTTLLAASEIVSASAMDQLKSDLDNITGNATLSVGSWQEWLTTVSSSGPSFLVALPHREAQRISGHDFYYLEINQDHRKCQEIDKRYVLGPHSPQSPLVILLGCETADPNVPLSSFIRAFRNGGAAIVIGTVAKVFGEHAVEAADMLARHLFTEARKRPVPFGEVLRDVRRACLADGLLMILSVAAFGDADWLVSAS